MQYIILGQQRFALPVGETRIGGPGSAALPLPQLAPGATVAVILVRPDHAVTLRAHGGSAMSVLVDGVPVAGSPVPLAHGAKIDVAGARLIFGDAREDGSTTRIRVVVDEKPVLPALRGQSEATADTGGRLTVRRSGAVVAIPDRGLVIGRGAECDVVLRSSTVSRRHAVIRPSIQGYVVWDASTNGTFVNGRRVDGSEVLGMGDVIRIGDEEFRFDAEPATYEPMTGSWVAA